ncbi:chemotaxis protein CheA [Methylobacterium sp. ID0610]|uniref:chemotaxis protein CheA n=1 Tax=Methylobacterium carpenticola TaxID=3344827 RepID=UPI00367E946B
MMSVEIDPTERRETKPARLAWRGPVLIAAAGLGGVVALGALAYPAVSALMEPRASGIRVGPVREMPEIKDGVPALRADGTEAPRVRTVAIPPASPVEKPAEAAPVAPVPARADSLVTGTLNPPQHFERALPAGPDAKLAESKPTESRSTESKPVEAKAAEPKVTESKASEAKAVGAKPVDLKPVEPKPVAVKPAQPKPAAPAPETHEAAAKPAAPVKAAVKPEKPAPKPVAKSEKPEPAKITAAKPPAKSATTRTAAAEPAPAAPAEPEPRTFLGLPVPDLAPAGKAIKDTVDAVGDAVINFPKRL